VISCAQVKVAQTPEVIKAKPSDVFVTKSTQKWILGAVDCANKVFHLDETKSLILAATYEQTNDNSFEVLKKIEQTKLTQVKEIWPKNIWSRMTATIFKGDPAIYLNARKPRSISSVAGSIFHEALGHKNGYSHKGNYRKGNEKTVPYVLGDIGGKMAEKHCN